MVINKRLTTMGASLKKCRKIIFFLIRCCWDLLDAKPIRGSPDHGVPLFNILKDYLFIFQEKSLFCQCHPTWLTRVIWALTNDSFKTNSETKLFWQISVKAERSFYPISQIQIRKNGSLKNSKLYWALWIHQLLVNLKNIKYNDIHYLGGQKDAQH